MPGYQAAKNEMVVRMADKLPAWHFYVGDWRKDPGVQSLSYHDRGVWFEILCLMFESCDRGKLLLNGQMMTDDALSRLLGLDRQVLTNTLATLLERGVASRDAESGALVCRRMVRDERLRKMRIDCGRLGGNPNLVNHLVNQKSTTQVNQIPTLSVSSSASTLKECVREGPSVSSKLPKTEAEAIEWAAMSGVPAMFAAQVFHQCVGVNWIDIGKRPIAEWRSYVRGRYLSETNRQEEAKALSKAYGKRGRAEVKPNPKGKF